MSAPLDANGRFGKGPTLPSCLMNRPLAKHSNGGRSGRIPGRAVEPDEGPAGPSWAIRDTFSGIAKPCQKTVAPSTTSILPSGAVSCGRRVGEIEVRSTESQYLQLY